MCTCNLVIDICDDMRLRARKRRAVAVEDTGGVSLCHAYNHMTGKGNSPRHVQEQPDKGSSPRCVQEQPTVPESRSSQPADSLGPESQSSQTADSLGPESRPVSTAGRTILPVCSQQP